MSEKRVKVKAPATIANLGCGFDVLGLCISQPQENYELILNDSGTNVIEEKSNYNLPLKIDENVCGVALQAFFKEYSKDNISYKLIIDKFIKPGSGLGSSAASASAAVFAMNHLLNKPFDKNKLVTFAMQGETLASGIAHADNVAPCILGGITLVRRNNPLEVINLNVPSELFICVIHPQIELKTSEARAVLKPKIYLKEAIQQWANVGSLVAAFYKEDYELMGKSLEDFIIEPQRKKLIPWYNEVKQVALKNGALGGSISGSGPSIFFFCKGSENAEKVRHSIENIYLENGIKSYTIVSAINTEGCTVMPD